MRPFLPILLAVVNTTAAEEIPLIGKDLSNWTFESKEGSEASEKSWSLQDGMLSTTGSPSGFIRSRETYSDYTITLEWRWIPAEVKRHNSGLLLHTLPTSEGEVWPPTIEVQLQKDSAGDLRMNGGATLETAGKLQGLGWKRLADPKEKPLGEWNTITVICKADTISVHINGTLVNQGENLSSTSGNIGLQAEGAPIQFRNIILIK